MSRPKPRLITIGFAILLALVPLALWLGCGGGGGGGGGVPPSKKVPPDVLIVANTAGEIYAINPDKGTTALLTTLDPPYQLSSLAYDSDNGILYGGANSASSTALCPLAGGCIISVNRNSGATNLVVSPTYAVHPGMSIDPLTGTLYAMHYWQLATVNTVAGTITPLGGGVPSGGNGLTFTGSGMLYATGPMGGFAQLYELDKTSGTNTLLREFTFTGFPDLTGPQQVLSMAVRPRDGQAFGIVNDGGAADYLAELDLCRAEATYVGTLPPGMDGMTFLTTRSRPALPPTCAQASARNDEVEVSWQDYPNATVYNLYWSTASGIDPSKPATYASGGTTAGVTSPEILAAINDTTYYYVVTAVVDGKEIASDELSATPNGDVAFNDFEDAGALGQLSTGWTRGGTSGTWGAETDPVRVHSGTYSMGDSPGTFPAASANEWLASPTFDFTGYNAVRLEFFQMRRMRYDHAARVEVSVNGGATFVEVKSYTGYYYLEGAFQPVTLDLTPYITNFDQVVVRFRYTASITPGDSVNYSGWYVDDVAIVPYIDPEIGTLLAADPAGFIYQINPLNGGWTLLYLTSPAYGLSSMAYDADNDILYGGVNSTDSINKCPGATGCIIAIDRATGDATVALTPTYFGIDGMTIDPGNGDLYSTAFGNLYYVDLVGQTLNVRSSGAIAGGEGITFAGDGKLYASGRVAPDVQLYNLSKTGGAVTSLGNLTFTGFPAFGGNPMLNSLTVRTSDGKMFGILSDGAGAYYLATIDPCALEATYVGVIGPAFDGLVFINETPTLPKPAACAP